MKLFIKEKAIKLRKEGYSYSYIKDKLGISKGTLSYWLRDIKYVPNEYTLKTENFHKKPDHRPYTKYEKRGLNLGHKVWDIIFLRS